ncbi:MAG: hypothetical protein KJN84_05135 [Bacteroidia bacterium]|nr:hypothetical protein [Bacteroidia bacterium]
MKIKYILTLLLIIGLVLVIAFKKDAFNFKSYDDSYDELVKGLYFGMDKQEFFSHCWDLNQKGETHHGTIDNNVMYVDSINFDPKVIVNFYPEFLDDKISKLPMSFYFHGWAPWNKNLLSQDSLSLQVMKLMEAKYGEGFEKRTAPNGRPFHIKFAGPLMIRVYNDIDEMIVKADISHKYYQGE